MIDSYKNFAISIVAVAPSPALTGTSLTVQPGEGTYFPTVPFNAVICPQEVLPMVTNAEIVRVTSVVGDVLTFTRLQEGSLGRAVLVGDLIYDGITKKLIDDLFQSIQPGPAGPIGPAGPAGPPGPTGPPGAATAVGDASYWVVGGHTGLTNERILSSLANGYVKSTAGEPSTVAVIPIAEGGTGATTAEGARANLGVDTAAGGIPSGLIMLSLGPCPAGYTRVNLDGYFLRSGPTPGATGGTWSHAHGPGSLAAQNHQHGSGSYQADEHDHGGGGTVSVSGNTGDAGDHAHGFNVPVDINTGDNLAGINTADAGASFNVPRAPHQHQVAFNYIGTTNNAGTHAHNFSGSGAVSVWPNSPGIHGTSGDGGAVGIVGLSDEQSHLPPFYDIFLCRKD